MLLARVVSFFICYYSLKPILHFLSKDLAICHFAVTPGEGCTGWGRNTCFQPDEEESERKGSRKKGRTRGCGPYREHSADARWGDCSFAEVLWSKAYTFFCCIPILELLPELKGMIWNTKPFLAHSVKPPHEGSRQRSCSAPNLRRSPRHSPAVPGVPSLVEMGEQEERSRSVFVWHMHTPHYIRGSCSLKVAGWLEGSYFTPTQFLVVGLADSQMCMFAAVWRLCTFSKLNLERWSWNTNRLQVISTIKHTLLFLSIYQERN